MAALTAARQTKSKSLGKEMSYGVGVNIIYAGSLVMINSAGFAVPAVAAASNKGVPGVAQTTVDNSGGSAGDLDVVVQEGTFLFVGVGLAQGEEGDIVYASDDQTYSNVQGANEPRAGILREFVSSTSGWVQVSLSDAQA